MACVTGCNAQPPDTNRCRANPQSAQHTPRARRTQHRVQAGCGPVAAPGTRDFGATMTFSSKAKPQGRSAAVAFLATILGALKAGAAYVPVDAGAPPARGAYILHNCHVKALVIDAAPGVKLQPELAALGATPWILICPLLQEKMKLESSVTPFGIWCLGCV